MATLANTTGSRLTADVSSLAGGISDFMGRRRKEKDQEDLESKISAALGLGGPSTQSVDTAALGRLGQLSPKMAQAVGQAKQSPQQAGELRQEAQRGVDLAQELRDLPDHAARLKRLASEAGTRSAEGGNLDRLVKLSNMNEGALDLELQRMQLIGKDTLSLLPAPVTAQSAFSALIADNPQIGTALLGRRDTQIANERKRRAAAAAAKAAAARRARAAAGPQTALGKSLSLIRRDAARGHITQEVADQQIANLRSEATAGEQFEGASKAGKVAEDRINIARIFGTDSPELQTFESRMTSEALDPESPEGKRFADTQAVNKIYGEGSPQAKALASDIASGLSKDLLSNEKAAIEIENGRLENEKLADEMADPNSDLSTKEQQINRIMEGQGVDRSTAQGLADGVIKPITDPVTGSTQIVNLATGRPHVETAIGPELPPLLPEGVTDQPTPEASDPSRTFGAQGFGINAVNTIAGAISSKIPFPKEDEAIQALDNLNTRTMLALSASFPGRPSNLTREKIEEMTASPATITMGRSRAVTKLKQVKALLAEAIAGADKIQTGQGSFTPQDRGEAAKAVTQLLPIWEDHDRIIRQLEGKKVIAKPVNAAEYDALPVGTTYIHPDGDQRVKR